MEIKHTSGRFYAKTEHGEAELLYSKIDSKTISVYHTFTPQEDRGQGVAELLATAVFEFAKEKGLKVKPDCPYIPQFLEKHKEWRKYSTD
ncbi:MAG: N-acetyltransferase [Candidatus Micrarchaeota archaeon]|nr:N-acetyltransferase [Candidatus Micrarchaeota archaeon]